MRQEPNHWANRELEKKLPEQILPQTLSKIRDLSESDTLIRNVRRTLDVDGSHA